MKIFAEWIEKELSVYYSEFIAIRHKQNNDLCVYGDEMKKTYKYQLLELQASLLKFKIVFWELFI